MKKISVVIVAFCLLFSSSLAINCRSLNPIISNFSNKLRLKEPIVPSQNSKCGAIWTKGQCCNETELATFAKEKNEKLSRQVIDLNSHLRTFVSNLFKFKEKHTPEQVEAIFGNSSLTRYLETLNNETHIEISDQTEKCWGYMKKARGAALCNACAADSAQYFYGQKAIISADECNNMISNCRDNFEFILAIVDSAVTASAKAERRTNEASKLQNRMAFIFSILLPKIDGNKAFALLEQSSANQSARIEICNQFYSLGSSSLIESINPFFKKYNNGLTQITAGLLEIHSDLEKLNLQGRILVSSHNQLSNWEHGERELAVFTPDVIVYDSLASMPIEDSAVHRRAPMNLSMIFP